VSLSHHVEKLRILARLAQPNLNPRDGYFLLFPTYGKEGRPESLFELLNSSRAVIPFLLREDKSVLLLTRLNIDWVAVSGAGRNPLLFPPNHIGGRQQAVELRFVDESRVEAVMMWRPRNDSERLSDVLNRPDVFVATETSFGALLVNKNRIREMRLRDRAESQPLARTG
jgi:hypothetical protein